jgi:hypothetical protein
MPEPPPSSFEEQPNDKDYIRSEAKLNFVGIKGDPQHPENIEKHSFDPL